MVAFPDLIFQKRRSRFTTKNGQNW